jgi:hypothetical protein
VASGLLDLESSITAEFEASVLLNRDLNLDMARQFALQNNMEGVIGEIQNQLAGQDFASLNRIQRESLAKAVNMSVGDLGRTMARSGQKLEGTIPEKQLKTGKDLLNQTFKMGGMLTKIISVLQWGFGLLAATNLLSGGLGKMLMKGGRGAWGALKASRAGNMMRGMTSRARGFSGPLTQAGRPNMRFKTNQAQSALRAEKSLMQRILGQSDEALTVTKGISRNSKVQREVLETVTKKGLGKAIPGVNAALMVGEWGWNMKKEGALEGTATTLKNNKYALGLAAGGAVAGTPFFGVGAGVGAGVGFLVGTGLDILSSFTGGWAKGGTVPRSGIGLVGERGPELISMSAGTQIVPNHYLGGYADGQFGMVDMKETNELLTQTIGLLSSVAVNTQGAADGIKNINIRTG